MSAAIAAPASPAAETLPEARLDRIPLILIPALVLVSLPLVANMPT